MGKVGPTDLRTKKLTGDGSTEEITMVTIYSLGLQTGLTVTDIDGMIAGEVIDLAYYKANRLEEMQAEKDNGRKATQADYDSF